MLLKIIVITLLKYSLAIDINNNNSIILECPEFENVENGIVIVSDDFQSVQIECKPLFDLFGPTRINCFGGKWQTTHTPKCAARCKKPPLLINGSVDIDQEKDSKNMYKKGALATYKCGEGFILTPPDSQYRVCEKGIWTGANVSCAYVEKITKCKPLKMIRNGNFIHQKLDDAQSFLIGQTVEYVCNNGYTLKGNVSQRCQFDGTWAPRNPPICISNDDLPTHCPPLPTFPHSKVVSGFQSYESAPAGTEVEIVCLPKYRNSLIPCESARLRCIAGEWIGMPPNCELVSSCRCPPKVSLGTPFLLPPLQFDAEKVCYYPVRSQISYRCAHGYELDGNAILTCSAGGCWLPSEPPVCKLKQRYYYLEPNGGEPIVFSLATGACVLLLLVIACLIIVCKKRKPLSRSVAIPPPVPRADLADHASLLHPPDRLALIAFADGMQVGQSGLPTYEEATRDRNLGVTSSRIQRPPWPSLVGRRSRNSPNPENMLFTRQGSFASHSASTRSGGDPMGSTDTMAVSENSTTVTLDTASSHSGSQPASCRAHCGSLASFDTSSVLNTEGVPLLEESELEEIQCGDTVSLAMENRSMCDNSSYKLSTASDLA